MEKIDQKNRKFACADKKPMPALNLCGTRIAKESLTENYMRSS
jgi:hypothetical protein